MIVSAIDKIMKLAREEHERITVYGNYGEKNLDAIYSEAQGAYVLNTIPPEPKTVSNMRSFIALVAEESRRLKNATGECMTVSLTSDGGMFFPDEDFAVCPHGYKRELSLQWKTLLKYLDKDLNHFDVLRMLRELKPSLGKEYQDLFTYYQELRVIGKSETISNPVFNGGSMENGYKMKYTIEGNAEEEAEFPAFAKLNLPYAKNSEKKYDLELEFVISLDLHNKPVVTPICPEFETIEEKAIFDEQKQFQEDEQIQKLEKLLILENY